MKRSFLDGHRAVKSYKDRVSERIRTSKLIARLQENALNELPNRPNQVREFLSRLADRWGVEKWNPDNDTNWAIQQLNALEMSMAQVKSAEVLLRKVLPDMAQIEAKQESKTTSIIMIPQAAQAVGDWTQTVLSSERALIEHDRINGIGNANGVAAPTGAANVPADVPGS